METLEKHTSMFVNPSTGEQYVIIKKDSGCAKLMQYALSERNDIVRNPNLLDHPHYQNPNDPDNIRLPIDMYTKVRGASAPLKGASPLWNPAAARARCVGRRTGAATGGFKGGVHAPIQVKQAYRKKLGEIAATSYDLTSIKVRGASAPLEPPPSRARFA
jgi:hypothetical protein